MKKRHYQLLLLLFALILLGTVSLAIYIGDTPTNELDSNDMISLNENNSIRFQYNEARANYIFEKFGMESEEYIPVYDFELLNYIETSEYTAIRETMNIQSGTTVPFFFVDVDTDIIWGVCQDSDAKNFMYKFSKGTDGGWSLCDTQELQDVGRYQDIHQSFSEFEASMD